MTQRAFELLSKAMGGQPIYSHDGSGRVVLNGGKGGWAFSVDQAKGRLEHLEAARDRAERFGGNVGQANVRHIDVLTGTLLKAIDEAEAWLLKTK